MKQGYCVNVHNTIAAKQGRIINLRMQFQTKCQIWTIVNDQGQNVP
jgi:hypothetical protein